MFYKDLHKEQMDFTVITASLTYATEVSLLHLESLKMIIQDAESTYPTNIPDSNEHLMESNVLLVQHITVLLQDHSMFPVALPYISPDPYSFPTSLPSEITSQGPNSYLPYK